MPKDIRDNIEAIRRDLIIIRKACKRDCWTREERLQMQMVMERLEHGTKVLRVRCGL